MCGETDVPEKRPDRTLGGVHDTFWDYCAKGELRLQKCEPCGHYTWPPLEACEACGNGELTWQRLSGRGTVASWCTFERDYYYGVMPVPYDNVLVELEEGPLFLSNPQGFTWRETEIGMPVALAFVECEDSNGTFNLPVFAKA
jgi:uncharacterized OB-fold protein